jgi:DNA polymerase III alpha subunit
MSAVDRTLADYKNSGMTAGPHIMTYLRDELTKDGVLRACDLPGARDGRWTKIAGLVIVRQRPGTAKGFCFLTLEDETGTANAVVVPDMFQRHRALIHTAALLQVEGPLQKVAGPRGGVGCQVAGAGGEITDHQHPTSNTDSTTDTQHPTPNTHQATDTRHPTPDTHYVIHVRARRFRELELPQQPITLTGHGYRMRVTPEEPMVAEGREPDNQQPHNERPLSLPKSHDFR